MKKLIPAVAALAAFGLYAATITTIPALPDVGAGVFTQQNHDAINTASTTANINFANLNTALGLVVPTSTFIDCATTAACPSTAQTAIRTVIGRGTLATGSPSTYAVTTISPAFTSTTSYVCIAQDSVTIATNIGVLVAGYVSGSAVTFTGPNTNTDTFRFTCTGF